MAKKSKGKDESPVRAVPDPPAVAHPERNPGMPLELDWVHEVRVNRSAVERRCATLPKRRSVKKDWQAAWLLRAIALTDLTTLQGDDTPGRVKRLCAKARQPVRADILKALGMADRPFHVGAVCDQQANDLEMPAAVFVHAVDRMAAISTDKSRSIKLALDSERLVLSANSPDSASGEEELPVEYSGPAIEIGFNSRYVLEMAQNFEGDQMRFQMADAVSPTIVHDTSDDRTLYVLMPMRV